MKVIVFVKATKESEAGEMVRGTGAWGCPSGSGWMPWRHTLNCPLASLVYAIVWPSGLKLRSR